MMHFDPTAAPGEAATTFQQPCPDNRRHAILGARHLLDQVMDLPEDDCTGAELLFALEAVKRSVNRVEQALAVRAMGK